jgi:hypothetical protein
MILMILAIVMPVIPGDSADDFATLHAQQQVVEISGWFVAHWHAHALDRFICILFTRSSLFSS